MKKAEIVEKINQFPMNRLSYAAHAIERSNPINVFVQNRAYVNERTFGGRTISLEIGFTTRATKENMLNVYYAILDEIVVLFGLDAIREIDAEYTPEWYCTEIEESIEESREPKEAQEAQEAAQNAEVDAPQEESSNKQARKTYTWTEGHGMECTKSAHLAMNIHRAGIPVTVWGYQRNGSQYHVRIPGAKKPEPVDENREYCKRIARELEAYSDGNVYRCPECGEKILLPDDVGDKYRCPHCQSVNDVDDMEQLGIWDYMEDALDIEYRIGGGGEYRNVRVMVTCGGPNIYIDTASASIKLYWWSDTAEYPISYDARDAVDEWAEELWNCNR